MPGLSQATATFEPLFSPDSRDSDARVFLKGSGALAAADIATILTTPITIQVNDVAGITAGSAVSITTDSFTSSVPLEIGTYLQFTDAAGSYPVRLTAAVAANTATTTITADVFENIPDNANTPYPVLMNLLTDLSDTDTTATTETSTFDHSGIAQVSRGNSSQSITISGNKEFYNAGLATLRYAKDNEVDVIFAIYEPNPDSTVFTTNTQILYGTGIVSELSSGRQNENPTTFNGSIAISGGFTTIDPA